MDEYTMKQFLIIGNKNALTFREIFPLIKENKMWIGYTTPKKFLNGNGNITTTLNGLCRWFTTMPVHKEKTLTLTKTYKGNEDKYPKYDNYDAIECGKVADIPTDYDGVIGVPITFLDKYCPEQFEILGMTQRTCHNDFPDTKKYDDYLEVQQDGTKTGSSGNKTNENPNIKGKPNKGNYFVNTQGDIICSLYQRIFIRRKKYCTTYEI